jgi:Icc protein
LTRKSHIKVIQLSDCHVSADPDKDYRGLNPRAQLEQLLIRVKDWWPDLLLVTGDLAEDASEQAYQYLEARFAGLHVPVLTIPGNHDVPELQKTFFPHTPTDRPVIYELSGWVFILINTAVPGEIAGSISLFMANQLKEELERTELPVILVIHHQPLMTGSPWIDRYPLQDPEKLWAIVDGNTNVKAVIWGHIHHGYVEIRNNVRLLGAPSTAANSLPEQDKFNLDPAGAGCRWFELSAGGALETGLLTNQRIINA